MPVIDIHAHFKRSVQPRPYESMEAGVALTERIEEGRVLKHEDAAGVIRSLLAHAKSAVYESLGLVRPAAPKEPASEGADPASADPLPAADPVPSADPLADPPKQRRKRRTRAQIDADNEVAAAEAKAAKKPGGEPAKAAGAEAMPPAEPVKTGRNISDNPENRADPNAGIPGEPAEGELSQTQLHQVVNQTARDVGVEDVKAVLHKFGAERTSEVKPEDRAAVKAAMDAMFEEKKGKKS